MLSTSASLALGFAFVLLGGVNVWLVLEAWSRVKAANASSRMLTLHRIGGYFFIALFCVMTYFMVACMRGGAVDSSAAVTLHLALAMILSPLLFITADGPTSLKVLRTSARLPHLQCGNLSNRPWLDQFRAYGRGPKYRATAAVALITPKPHQFEHEQNIPHIPRTRLHSHRRRLSKRCFELFR